MIHAFVVRGLERRARASRSTRVGKKRAIERLGAALAVLSTGALAGCAGGLPARPVSDAASHIEDTAAAGKAAFAKCASEKTNCDEVTAAFDLVTRDAQGLKKLAAGAP